MAEWNHGAAPAKNKLIPKANITQITRSGRTLRYSIRICSSSEIIVVAWLRVYTFLQQQTHVGLKTMTQVNCSGALWNCEKIDDSQSCQMSNVCCAMSDELVKRLTDEMT